jgi:hypothetical protein
MKAYDALGSKVQAQLDDLLNGEDACEQNPAALALLDTWLEEVTETFRTVTPDDLTDLGDEIADVREAMGTI